MNRKWFGGVWMAALVPVLAALAALAAVEPVGAAGARPPVRPGVRSPVRPKADPGTTVDSLSISILTGGDDVRSNSHVIVYAYVQQGNTQNRFSFDMNNGASWGEGSTNTGTLSLPPGTKVSDIRLIGVHFDSGQRFFTDQPDNWNMASITVTYGNGSILVNQASSPYLWRFKGGNEQDWTDPLN